MTIALSAIREAVCRLIGDWLPATTTTNLTGTNAYIISTELVQYPDDYFNDNWYALITSGNNIGVSRVVKDFIQSSGQVEVYGANLAAETGAVTFELHQFNPAEITQKINDARLEAYPLLNVPVKGPNHHFENWSQTTYPDYWRVSEVTALAETGTANIHNGAKSAKVTRAGADGYLYISTAIGISSGGLPLDVYNALFALRGQKVRFAKWGKALTALQARLAIYCGSEARTRYSPFHTGGGSFEYLEVEFDIPWDASEVAFRCYVITTDGAVYFDGAGSADDNPIVGVGYLSSVSSETDKMELNDEQARGLAYLAGALLLESKVLPIGSEEVGRYAAMGNSYRAKARDMLRAHRTPQPVLKFNYGWLGYLTSEG